MPPTPQQMQALELRDYDGLESLVLVEKPVPQLRPHEVLVKLAASPANPSDIMFIRGLYGFKKSLPVTPGFEGSGVVVASGGSWMGRFLLGRRVACAVQQHGDGTWAEYVATPATLCVPLLRQVTVEQGATLIVNPLTAWALLDIARRGRHRAIAHTAAASALGRMLLRLGQQFNLPILHIVRRPAQVELLRELGAKYVLDSSTTDFEQQLKQMCRELNVTLAYDAVAGAMTGQLVDALPRGGRVVVYGALAEELCQVNPGQFIFGGKRVEGFWLSSWMARRNFLAQLWTAVRVQRALGDQLQTEIQARYPLHQGISGLEQYVNNMTGGKVLLLPGEK